MQCSAGTSLQNIYEFKGEYLLLEATLNNCSTCSITFCAEEMFSQIKLVHRTS